MFGHFARVLVDIDLKSNLHNQIMFERDDYAFFVGLEYEKLPAFYSSCQIIGHDFSTCKKNKKDMEYRDLKAKNADHRIQNQKKGRLLMVISKMKAMISLQRMMRGYLQEVIIYQGLLQILLSLLCIFLIVVLRITCSTWLRLLWRMLKLVLSKIKA